MKFKFSKKVGENTSVKFQWSSLMCHKQRFLIWNSISPVCDKHQELCMPCRFTNFFKLN